MSRNKEQRSNRMMNTLRKKLLVVFLLILAAFAFLGFRLYTISRDNEEDYKKQILSQQEYDSKTIPYKRGNIVDANGTILAVSNKVYNVILDAKVLLSKEEYLEPTLNALHTAFGLDSAEVRRYVQDNPSSQYYVLAKKLSYDQISAYKDLQENSEEGEFLKGIWFEEEYQRQYPNKTLACDVVGFMVDDSSGYGLEAYYNDELCGVNGREYGYLNEDSTLERTTIPAQDGNTIVTTIDSNIQGIVEKYLQEFNDEYENNVRQGNGAENVGCIIMEVDTGNVLAMASYPFYDLNNPRDPSRLIGMRQVNRKGNKTKGEATEEDVYALMELEKAAWEKQNAAPNSGSTDTASSDPAEGAEESDEDASQENREEAAADTENSSPDTDPDSDEAYENEEDLEDWEIEDSSEENSDDISSFMQPTEAIKAKADLLAQKNISEESLAAMDDDLLYQNFDALWKNFCINDTYEPGSVAKPFTVAAAIDSGAITGNEGYNCEGKLHVGDHDIKCHNVYGDGYLTVQQAIERSCNVALMHIANATGKQQFLRYQRNFGFGLKTNIDLAGESRTASLVYNVDTMGPTDLATNSFGQGFNTTMIQMITGFCSLINGGNLYEPHMVSKIMTSDGATIQNIEPRIMKQTVSPTTSEKIIEYCNTVVTGEYGTGKTARPAGYMIGGKTGTAQTLPRGNGEYVVSFMGYAPADDPQIAIYVVVDRPNRYGQDDAKFATRIVRNILTEVLPYLHIYMTEELSEKEIKELEEKQLQDTIIMQQHAAELTGETIPEEENGGASGGDNAGNGEAPGGDNSENGENTENGTGEEEPEEERLERNEPWKDFPIDPETGYAKDPNTGYLVDTETGAVVAGLDEIPSETSSEAGSEEPSAEKQE